MSPRARGWTSTAFDDVPGGGATGYGVIVSLPRFSTEAACSLKPVLCALGGGPLQFSEVVHKAFGEINEEGTEAAAATALGMAFGAAVMPTTEPIVFKADHLFLFFIRDRRTNAVLFSGRVLDPR
jgi:serine protease inhibitor